MTVRSPRNPLALVRLSDLRGLAQLATEATAGVARIAEEVHRSVRDVLGVPGGDVPGRTTGITGLAYRGVHAVTRLVGDGADAVLADGERWLDSGDGPGPATPARERALAVLNGVMGDRLADAGNPLAIPMTLRHRGEFLDCSRPLAIPGVTARPLLLIHGLCGSDLDWRARRDRDVHDHGEALASAFGYTPVHVRYNTGLHVSRNGRELSSHLERLAARWPVPIEDWAVVAHSMGGLVIRSAFHYGRRDGRRWPDLVRSIVFLGTPHHGAPLERAGNRVDTILAGIPRAAPFARLARIRSAGITDLRYGHLLDEDGQGHDRFHRRPDRRQVVPLPEGVACHAVAANRAAGRGLLADRVVGDGLVPVWSALGRHEDARRTLAFPESAQAVVHCTSHMGLLGSPEVADRLLRWLRPPSRRIPGFAETDA
jgi:hypothetical protein